MSKKSGPYYIGELLDEKINEEKQLKETKKIITIRTDSEKFYNLCEDVKNYFNNLEIGVDDLERQKKAIIGYTEEVSYYKDKIEEYLKENNLLSYSFPKWYSNLSDAIFQELWGLAGIAQWYQNTTEKLKNSSSAKIIGEKIYFMIDGKTKLMPQTISYDRRKQLRRALLSNDFRVRLDNDVPDIEMVTGERIKIFGEDVTRKGMDTIIFRKFPVKDYTFEKQVELGTYPKNCLNLFKAIAEIGYNMAFTGAVRTGKTTHLATWLSYEDPTSDGLIVETRPEIPLKDIMPNAPIIPLVVDTEEKLSKIRASIMRSDADYVIMAEARDAYAFDIALKSANVGTRRCKLTAHVNEPFDFPYEFAKEITRTFGGNMQFEAISVAKAYTLNFHFINHPKNRSQKRLEGIYIFDFNPFTYEIYIYTLCKYNILMDDWTYNFCVTDNMENIGKEQNYDAFLIMCEELKKLVKSKPMNETDARPVKPFYSR
ncbi:Flp pilus assembly complex ATPase component TadA [Sedimentibacter sp. zth1]|uniref:ATPase, T2SS/T4P/T4SS family n=1 Tax=Sedimentibacter sp. zth1 TaxID=2816908 RepID=UPI001A9381DC|nr:ATPase, T2SS/T4P/T4SS family [Sedimentibacter sp. zth1]QSX04919.1 Flp pilus assembly complex ATPase component TadA [Sedimentibacter sp. zth1]